MRGREGVAQQRLYSTARAEAYRYQDFHRGDRRCEAVSSCSTGSSALITVAWVLRESRGDVASPCHNVRELRRIPCRIKVRGWPERSTVAGSWVPVPARWPRPRRWVRCG